MSIAVWLSSLFLCDLPVERRWSFVCFALALCISLGTSQFLGPVKTAVFLDLVGTQWEPVAKSLVLVVLLPVLVLYSCLVSLLRSARLLVACVCAAYTLIFLSITIALLLSKGKPGAWLAWVLYYAAETKSVIVMPMIWSVIADVSTWELSKQAYPFIFFLTQLGGILGSMAAMTVSSLGGEVGLLLLQTAAFVAVVALTWLACGLVACEEESAPLLQKPTGSQSVAKAAGQGTTEAWGALAAESADSSSCPEWLRQVLQRLQEGIEGLWLLLSRPYVFMVFWVSYANLVPRTILDYQNSVLVSSSYPQRREQIEFFGRVNLLINCGVAAAALLGARPAVECCGMRNTLLALPCATLACIALLCSHHGLWMSVWALSVSCVVAYGINSPCKEMLYVVASREIKYKAKSWSEMYGNQLMKLLGAQINLWVNRESGACHPHCFHSGSTVGIVVGWVVLWIAVVFRLGQVEAQLQARRISIA
mmetsp:Transcript_89985/g.291218  ORF Transcript_89985/g.291218 Transcript_89985/m.291218 type:complete len:479 (-) Transcript_89985:337-1773(-)